MGKRKISKASQVKESPLFWPARLEGSTLWVLDETLIPAKVKYLPVKNVRQAVQVIRQMKTRAFGQFLVVLSTFLLELHRSKGFSQKKLLFKIDRVAEELNQSRPTFPFSEVTSLVVRWAAQAAEQKMDVAAFVEKCIQGYLYGIRQRRWERVRKIAVLLRNGDSVLTHCNVSGELAMAAVLCRQKRKKIQFFATETRPYFQGAKLTCWELKKAGVDVTLIADNAVATVMADRMVNKVIVGSDRNCANGDFANKIGTYQIAVLAREFGIPFYVLTQPSSKIRSGKDIPIEMRDEKEILIYQGKRVFASGVKGLYPGFDVVPHDYISKAVPINVN